MQFCHALSLNNLTTVRHIPAYSLGLILHVSCFDKIEMNSVGPRTIPAFLSSLVPVLATISSVLILALFVEMFQSRPRSMVIFSAIFP